MAKESNTNAPNMPIRAGDPVLCRSGGKHSPTTKERLDANNNNQHIKYTVCKKCNRLLP